jgi:hypothetical protein
LYTSAPPSAATLPDRAASQSMCGFSMMNNPRGAIIATVSCVSTGSVFGLPVKALNASPSHGCSP